MKNLKKILIIALIIIALFVILIFFEKGGTFFYKVDNMSQLKGKEGIQDNSVQNSGNNKSQTISHDKITIENYGEYVDLQTNIIVKDNIALEDRSIPKTDWRIFHKDNDGGIYLILSDYLPYSYESTINSGLSDAGEEYSHNWRSSVSRVDLLNKLNDESKWNKLLPEKYINQGMKVTGAITLDTWVESWNAKGYTKLYISKKTETKDGLEGCYIDTTENSESTYKDLSTDTEGYGNSLYFPHKNSTARNMVYAYTLATPSASDDNYLVNISLCGSVFYDYYSHIFDGLRPAIYIPSDVKLIYENDVWKIN